MHDRRRGIWSFSCLEIPRPMSRSLNGNFTQCTVAAGLQIIAHWQRPWLLKERIACSDPKCAPLYFFRWWIHVHASWVLCFPVPRQCSHKSPLVWRYSRTWQCNSFSIVRATQGVRDSADNWLDYACLCDHLCRWGTQWCVSIHQGDVACLGGSMVEHQPRCWGPGFDSRLGRFFPFLPKLHFQFPFPLSLPLYFPSSSFPFLFLTLRPFVCALKIIKDLPRADGPVEKGCKRPGLDGTAAHSNICIFKQTRKEDMFGSCEYRGDLPPTMVGGFPAVNWKKKQKFLPLFSSLKTAGPAVVWVCASINFWKESRSNIPGLTWSWRRALSLRSFLGLTWACCSVRHYCCIKRSSPTLLGHSHECNWPLCVSSLLRLMRR